MHLALPLLLTLVQTTPAPLPLVQGKDLPLAARGPMAPGNPDPGADSSPLGLARAAARRGPSIPARALPGESTRLADTITEVSGRQAYAAVVPAHGEVRFQVTQGKKAYFRVSGVNAWGNLEPGLLQNTIWKGEPLASYRNPTAEARTIYFIVETTDANMLGEPFEAEVIRRP